MTLNESACKSPVLVSMSVSHATSSHLNHNPEGLGGILASALDTRLLQSSSRGVNELDQAGEVHPRASPTLLIEVLASNGNL